MNTAQPPQQMHQELHYQQITPNAPIPMGMDQGMAQAVFAQLVEMINSQKAVNPARMVLFNQSAANNYQNQYFSELLSAALEAAYLVAQFAQRTGQNVQSSVAGIVQQLIMYRTSRILVENQGLMNFLPPHHQNDAWNKANQSVLEFPKVMANIQAQLNGGAGQGGWQNSGQAGGWGNQSGAKPAWGSSNQSTTTTWGEQRKEPVASWKTQKAQETVPEKKNKAEDSGFVRSEKMPHPYAYDHNLSPLRYGESKQSKGKVVALFEENSQVDRELHLTPPRYGRKYSASPTMIRSDQRIEEMINGRERRNPLITAYNDCTTPIVNIDEIWAPLCNRLSTLRASGSDVHVVTQDLLLVHPISSQYDPTGLLQRIFACKDYATASKLLDAEVTLHRDNTDAMVVLNDIVVRLTASVNLWVSGNATLLKGRIDDFIEDAPQLSAFLQKEYDGGKPGGVSQAFDSAYELIVGRAILQVSNEKLKESLDASYDIEAAQEDGVVQRYFQQSTPAYLVDLSSTELRLEFSVPKVFNSLHATTCPTAFKIFTKIVEDAKTRHKLYDELYIRTNDGIVYRVLNSAFVPGAICVGLK